MLQAECGSEEMQQSQLQCVCAFLNLGAGCPCGVRSQFHTISFKLNLHLFFDMLCCIATWQAFITVYCLPSGWVWLQLAHHNMWTNLTRYQNWVAQIAHAYMFLRICMAIYWIIFNRHPHCLLYVDRQQSAGWADWRHQNGWTWRLDYWFNIKHTSDTWSIQLCFVYMIGGMLCQCQPGLRWDR